MAITDTIASIKDYFNSWHSSDSHSNIKTNNVALNNTNVPTSDAVKKAIDNVSEIMKYKGRPVNDTLDEYDRRIDNKVDKTKYANNGKNSWAYDGDSRGVYFEPTKKENGLMTWADKAYLMELGTWHKIEGQGVTANMAIWVNFALRLVYFAFAESNSTKLKNSTEYKYSPDEPVWYEFRPLYPAWSPTNVQGVRIGVASDCTFYIRSDRKIAKAPYNGTIMWFYRDGDGINYEASESTIMTGNKAYNMYGKFG